MRERKQLCANGVVETDDDLLQLGWRRCQYCGELFTVTDHRGGRKYCSPECLWKEHRARQAEKRGGVPPGGRIIHCEACGVEVHAKRKDTRFCMTPKCRRARYERRFMPDDPALRPTAADLRRLLSSAEKCPLCKTTFGGSASKQPQIDHIVPRAIGGTDTIDNLRVICADCNVRRPRDGRDVLQETLWSRVG